MQVFLQHLSFIFHCLSYSNNVKAVLDFHASILSQVESGLLSWSRSHDQTFTLQRLNFRSGLKDLPTQNPQKQSSSQSQKQPMDEEMMKRKAEAEKQCCEDYNKRHCKHTGDHDGLLHVCFYCWYKRDTILLHPGNNCPSDPRPNRK